MDLLILFLLFFLPMFLLVNFTFLPMFLLSFLPMFLLMNFSSFLSPSSATIILNAPQLFRTLFILRPTEPVQPEPREQSLPHKVPVLLRMEFHPAFACRKLRRNAPPHRHPFFSACHDVVRTDTEPEPELSETDDVVSDQTLPVHRWKGSEVGK